MIRGKFAIVSVFAVVVFSTAVTMGDIVVPQGFRSELWLENAGPLRGVAVARGGAFGHDPYVGSLDGNIYRVTAKNTQVIFSTVGTPGCPKLAFDTGGSFGSDMYVTFPDDGENRPPSRIFRVTPSGQASLFFCDPNLRFLTNGVAFGKGVGFGDKLYVQDRAADHHCLLVFTPDGERSELVLGAYSGCVADDLRISAGGAFGENAYMTDVFGAKIYRISPSGNTTVFASGHGGVALAFGEGSFGEKLYLGSGGAIYAYDAAGNPSLFASGFPAGVIEGLDIAGDDMWVSMGTGYLYRIYHSAPVAEPVGLSLLMLGSLPILGRKRR